MLHEMDDSADDEESEDNVNDALVSVALILAGLGL